jgi:hypothetical protein
MTDRNRNVHDQEPEEQQSSNRAPRDSRDMADDRGIARDRRSFSGDREHDELGSEMEDDLAVEDRDDLAMDDGLGDPDHSDR